MEAITVVLSRDEREQLQRALAEYQREHGARIKDRNPRVSMLRKMQKAFDDAMPYNDLTAIPGEEAVELEAESVSPLDGPSVTCRLWKQPHTKDLGHQCFEAKEVRNG